MTHQQRIARIEDECCSPLGYAMRGVSSWDQGHLTTFKSKEVLTRDEMARLFEIEVQVFGYSEMVYDR